MPIYGTNSYIFAQWIRYVTPTALAPGVPHPRWSDAIVNSKRSISQSALLVRKALLRLRVRHRVRDGAKRALGVLSAFTIRYQIPDAGINLALEADPASGRADTGVLDEDLAGLFIEVGGVARDDGIGVLLMIDEVQYLSQTDLAALIIGLHRVSQEQLPFMVAGAGLPSLPGLAGEAKSYAERLFDFPEIGSLTSKDARLALTRPAEAEGVTWTDAALGQAFELTQGYPYFLQELGKWAWDVAAGHDDIARADIGAATPIVVRELDTGFFRARLDRTTDSERNYLRAMASLGPGPYKSSEVAKTLDKTTAQAGPVRDTLIKRGLALFPSVGTSRLYGAHVRPILDPSPRPPMTGRRYPGAGLW